jgi:hypothetical protein
LTHPPWSFRVLGVDIEIHCGDSELLEFVKANWGALATRSGQAGSLVYRVSKGDSPDDILITRVGQTPIASSGIAEFIYDLEKDIILELQRRRADFYFLHGATAERNGKACLLVAPSGQGKSTTVWALLHHGWNYLSDELAPIDLATLHVHAYPHALCLKRKPPDPYGLPNGTLSTFHTLHVPTVLLPGATNVHSCPLAAVLFLEYVPAATNPAIHSITTGEASARLYANALNQLAHPNAGLEAAVYVARSVPNFRLDAADISDTCQLITSTMEKLLQSR